MTSFDAQNSRLDFVGGPFFRITELAVNSELWHRRVKYGERRLRWIDESGNPPRAHDCQRPCDVSQKLEQRARNVGWNLGQAVPVLNAWGPRAVLGVGW